MRSRTLMYEFCVVTSEWCSGYVLEKKKSFLSRFKFYCLLKENDNSRKLVSISSCRKKGASLGDQTINNLPALQEMQVQFLGQKDPLEKGMATHSSILSFLDGKKQNRNVCVMTSRWCSGYVLEKKKKCFWNRFKIFCLLKDNEVPRKLVSISYYRKEKLGNWNGLSGVFSWIYRYHC